LGRKYQLIENGAGGGMLWANVGLPTYAGAFGAGYNNEDEKREPFK